METDSFELVSGGTLSWVTRLSRTRVSSVQGISLSQEPDPVIHSLDDVLRTVQRVGTTRCPFNEIETVARVGEGVSFNVDKCIFQNKTVAVKHIKVDAIKTKRKRLNSRLRRVLNEVRIMCHAPLREHPNILSMVGYGWRSTATGTLPYIVVEYASHGSLRHYLKRHHRDLRTKIILAGDTAAGLNALHQCGIAHGDLKLDNIVVLDSPNRPGGVIARLCDFGHSIVLSADKKHLKYYGTPLYNAPEVDHQDANPIDPDDLPKCDFWAYALGLWEILLDGATFFKESWGNDPSYLKPWPESLLSSETLSTGSSSDVDMKDIPNESTRVSKQANEQNRVSIFRNFDPKNLCGLVNEHMKTLNFGSAFVDKAVLRKLLNRALQVNPEERPTKITLGPLMGNWNPADANALYAKLAIHTGSSQWSCNILKPDQEKEIMWEHQVQILEDLEQIAKRKTSDEEKASAAFQAGMCYMSGFGTSKQATTSARFFREAEELNNIPAKLFGQSLTALVASDRQGDLPDYLSQVIRGFSLTYGCAPSTIFNVQWRSVGANQSNCNEKTDIDPPNYEDISSQTVLAEGTDRKTFHSYAELKRWVTEAAGSGSEPYLLRPETFITTTPASVRMSLLESAILHNDGSFAALLLKDIEPSIPGPLGDTPLIVACRKSNMDLVRLLLLAGADPFQVLPDGSNFFHWLFMLGGDVRSLFTLVDQDWVHKQKDRLNESCVAAKMIDPQWPLQLLGPPLAFSVATGSFSSTAALIRFGASPTSLIHGEIHVSDMWSWTPVHLAVKYHSPEMLLLLLLSSPSLLSHLDAKMATSLKTKLAKMPYMVEILGSENAPLAKTLLNKMIRTIKSPVSFWGASIGCALSFSTTAERIATHGVHHEERLAEIIALLPASCFESALEDGMTPLMQAIDFNDTSVVAALLNRFPKLADKPFQDPQHEGQYTFPIHFASQIAARRDTDDALEIIKLLARFASKHVSIEDSSGKTPLHYSVTGPFQRATRWLIQNRCPVGAVDNNGQTALLVAQSTSNLITLFDAGAVVSHQDKSGRTALHVAASIGAEVLIDTIVKRGAILDIKDKLGRTSLHHAVTKRSTEACAILLDAGASVNSVTVNGDTPLHVIVRSFRRDVAQLLVNRGADFSIANKNSNTPLHECILSGDFYCLNWLLEALQNQNPALIDAVDSQKRTALHVSATFVGSAMARALVKHFANVRMLDTKGNTAFHLALQTGEGLPVRSQADRLELCTFLYKNWTTSCQADDEEKKECPSARDVFITNNNGQTPWDIAYQQGDLIIIEFLLREAGLDACQQLRINDKYVGDHLLDLAIEKEEWDLALTLLRNGIIYMHPMMSDWARKQLESALAEESNRTRDQLIRQIFRDSWKQDDWWRKYHSREPMWAEPSSPELE